MNNVSFKWSRKYRNYQFQAQETLGELVFTSGKPFILGDTDNLCIIYIETSVGRKQVCSELF